MQDTGFEIHKHKETATRKENIVTMIFCVVAAFCIWLYVMSVDSPTATETYTAVPVTIIGAEDTRLSALSGTDQVIEVRLKGRKTILNTLKAEDIEASVDVSGVTTPGKGRYAVTVEAPAGTIIDDFYPAEVSIYMDEKTILSVPVKGLVTDYTVTANCRLDLVNYTRSIDSVQVSGPISELEKIDYARVTLRPGNVTQSFSGTAPLELVDVNGNLVTSKYVSLLTSEATLSYNVYTSKYLTLSVGYKYGYFDNGAATVSVSPNRVRVQGLVETLSQLSGITVATVDETKIVEDGTYGYSLTLPDGVEFPEEATTYDSVSVSVRFNSNMTSRITVPAEQIQVTNVPDGKRVKILDKNVIVSLRGDEMSVMYMSQKDVAVSLDLSAAGKNNGTQYVAATVSLKNGSDASHYVVGEYTVQVSIEDEGSAS